MASAPDQPLDDAEAAVEVAASDPGRARLLAARALAGGRGDHETVSVATRALGLAASAEGDAGRARRHLRSAVRRAERADLPRRAAEARTSLAFVLAGAGATAAALAEVDRAAPALAGLAAARLHGQRAIILTRLGRLDEALASYERGLAGFRRAGDSQGEARLRTNRGILHGYRGSWRAAEADLQAAAAIHHAAGRAQSASSIIHNRGFVAALRGDIPAALAHFDEAEAGYRASGGHPGLLLLDRAEALLSVRLVAESRLAAEAAVAEYRRRGMVANLAEGQLVLAQAALLGDDPDLAARAAGSARRAFARQARPNWAALARFVGLRACWAAGRRGPAELAGARRAAADLAAAGWAGPSLDARLLAARLALDLGRPEVARTELAQAARAKDRGPADLRARAWHAEARRRLADGDRRGAAAALRAGIGVVDRFRATLGATELRAGASAHGEELARLGLRMAVEDQRPDLVLRWAERWRAGGLLMRPARPPQEAGVASDMARLRQAALDAEVAAREGRPTAPWLRRQAELEDLVRQRARHTRGSWGLSGPPPTVRELADRLGGRALVEYVELDGDLLAVVVAGGRARLHPLGPRSPVDAEQQALRFALRRLAFGAGPTGSQAAAARSVAASAQRLDELLLGPVRDDVGAAGLVIVPTGASGALPWPALPTCAGRPVTVAPSAGLWHRAEPAPVASAAPGGPGPVVLVAGPGLPGAGEEVEALGRLYPAATRLTGAGASTAAVAAALDGAGLAHVAAHGCFRSDNPLFSSLTMADGPLTVYDLEGLAQAPATVALSACDSGLADVGPGDELVGLASALFALGTRALVASVVPVPDDATRLFMERFHACLRSGQGVASALADARRHADEAEEPGLAVAARAFGCFGAG